jgi:hypothetical protein
VHTLCDLISLPFFAKSSDRLSISRLTTESLGGTKEGRYGAGESKEALAVLRGPWFTEKSQMV